VIESGSYLGKYRGTVVNNIDLERRGRLIATVPDVAALTPQTWAMPCVPYAGDQAGLYVVPPIGAGVWIEFEQGNANYPIWTGCFWGGASELPTLSQAAAPPLQNVVLQTPGMTTLMLSDTPGPTGGILLKTSSGASIAVNDVGITLTNGKGATITLNGPSVSLNQGALLVK
jgi:uncharacterized protein involved in type VI secretion and phage assembly